MSNAPAAPQMVRRDDRAARGPGRVVKRNRRGARGTRGAVRAETGRRIREPSIHSTFYVLGYFAPPENVCAGSGERGAVGATPAPYDSIR
ncbi:hypothetical protein EVAR_77060_1 [Eumeta japonica]|uniref:Uncharacterized protein n=1 Tax=Eumeta variegata TaxID=151549 RepID=A0A4C2ADN0_EUMVA|nr:hypothetical protein EVAR_77060_1 [Eumeta japonica]